MITNGAPISSASSQIALIPGTGTAVPSSAAITRGLADHVVGSGRDGRSRRPPQHRLATLAPHQEGGVGVARRAERSRPPGPSRCPARRGTPPASPGSQAAGAAARRHPPACAPHRPRPPARRPGPRAPRPPLRGPVLLELAPRDRPSCAPRPARRRAAGCAGARTATRAGSRRTRRPPPCTWIARSITFSASAGAATLIAAISVRACLLPTVSISHAVLSVSRRIISMSMRDSAIQSWTFARSATGSAERHALGRAAAHQLERALGRADRAHAVVDAARAEPRLADQEAVALAGDQVRGRHAHVLEHDLGVPLLVRVAEDGEVAQDGHARACRAGPAPSTAAGAARASGSVLPITMRILQRSRHRAGGPPLAAVEHVVVAVALDAQLRRSWRRSWRRRARSSRTPSGSRRRAAAAASAPSARRCRTA